MLKQLLTKIIVRLNNNANAYAQTGLLSACPLVNTVKRCASCTRSTSQAASIFVKVSIGERSDQTRILTGNFMQQLHRFVIPTQTKDSTPRLYQISFLAFGLPLHTSLISLAMLRKTPS